jgi:hypothetical protein
MGHPAALSQNSGYIIAFSKNGKQEENERMRMKGKNQGETGCKGRRRHGDKGTGVSKRKKDRPGF